MSSSRSRDDAHLSSWLRGIFTSEDPPNAVVLPEGSRIGRRFTVVRAVGTGGFGTVYAVRDRKLRRRVAVKMMDPKRLEHVSARTFLREARAAARLPHPNIVVVHDVRLARSVIDPDGSFHDNLARCPILVMELLGGSSLRYDESRPLGQTLALMDQLCAAVAYAHNAGVIHRDLKPANILVEDDFVKVLDFGLAESFERAQAHGTEPGGGRAAGTPGYMAPEQARGEAQDATCDVFALGAILFELLTGQLPFARHAGLVASAPSPRPRSYNHDVPEALDDLVIRCLSSESKDRPENGTMLRAELTRIRAWVGQTRSMVTPTVDCPFPGLLPFNEGQARYFFGRGQDVRACLERLGRTPLGRRRWLVIEGPSGSGKSSLVGGGLLPSIKKGWIADGPKRWRVAMFRPGHDVIHAMQTALAQAFDRPLDRSGSSPLEDVVTAMRPAEGLLLVIDQFEELITLHDPDSATVDRFDEALSRQLQDPSGNVYVIMTLRSDFLDGLRRLRSLGPRLNTHASRYALPPLTGASLTEAVAAPVALAGLDWSPELIDRIVQEAGAHAGSLPLVAHLLKTLWQAHRGSSVTVETLAQHGGLVGALTQSADRLLDTLNPAGRLRAKRLLLALVKTGRGVPDTRRTLTKSEALRIAGQDLEAERILQALSGGQPNASIRLVVIFATDHGTQVDLAHEALLRDWPTLRQWIVEARQVLERRDDVEAAAIAWNGAGRPPGGLPKEAQLAYFQEADGVGPLGLAFLNAARTQEAKEARLRLQTQRFRVFGLFLALVLASSLAIWALYERQWVERQRAQALTIANELVEKVDAPLSYVPNAKKARHTLLNATADLLYTLQNRDGGDRQTRLNLMLVHGRRAQLAMTTDGLELALVEMRQAIQLYKTLARQGLHPDEAAVLLPTIDRMAQLLHLSGRYHDAWPWAETALTLAQIASPRADPRQKAGQIHNARANLASVVIRAGTLGEAQQILPDLHFEGGDPVTMARAHTLQADWAVSAGDLAQANAEFQSAWHIEHDRFVTHPHDSMTKRALAWTYALMGIAELKCGDPVRALEPLQASLLLLDSLRRKDPERIAYVQSYRRTELLLAEAELRTKQPSRARARLHRLSADLMSSDTPQPSLGVQSYAAETARQLGRWALSDGDPVAAEILHTTAFIERGQLHQQDPQSPWWKLELADSLIQLGHVAFVRHDLATARTQYRHALRLAHAILAKDPMRYQAQLIKVEASMHLARILDLTGPPQAGAGLRNTAEHDLDRMIVTHPAHSLLRQWRSTGLTLPVASGPISTATTGDTPDFEQ